MTVVPVPPEPRDTVLSRSPQEVDRDSNINPSLRQLSAMAGSEKQDGGNPDRSYHSELTLDHQLAAVQFHNALAVDYPKPVPLLRTFMTRLLQSLAAFHSDRSYSALSGSTWLVAPTDWSWSTIFRL